jgi:hypothetical protein
MITAITILATVEAEIPFQPKYLVDPVPYGLRLAVVPFDMKGGKWEGSCVSMRMRVGREGGRSCLVGLLDCVVMMETNRANGSSYQG